MSDPLIQINKTKSAAFSLVEVLLSSTLLALLVMGLAGVYIYGQESTMLSGQRSRAVFLAEEALEAVRSIRDDDFASLVAGTYGLSVVGNQWTLSGSSDTVDSYTRTVEIATVDTDRMNVTATVAWQQNALRTGTVVLSTELTNWQKEVPAFASCNTYAVAEGYTSGTCRETDVLCMVNSEIYLSDGDAYCTGGPPADVCCALPAVTTCNAYAVSEGYSAGTCRQNTQQCNNNSEDYLSAGNVYCTGGAAADTCCSAP